MAKGPKRPKGPKGQKLIKWLEIQKPIISQIPNSNEIRYLEED
jgi:hypothetical protein